MEFTTDIFNLFLKKWALLTAGNEDSFNTMTIGWGGLGTIWNKPVATVYVRTSRYTHDFMDSNDFFTVSFYSDQYRKNLGELGSKSGRDMDKMKESGLTPVRCGDSMSFEEAEITLVCKKIYVQRLEVTDIPEDVVKSMYEGQAPHDMYIGEIVDIIRKD
ncbi:MAG: flavin reductase [Lachnospiraceae bacterium]|nr:flavin reductase [Lachnospiraceae bacterium]